tara:strand:+ start:999 stop:1142 length:144 start_codon:yes stop_codon:yes gene_type:complete
MERPVESPPKKKIYKKYNSFSLGFAIGLSISATVLLGYYLRHLNLMV